MTAERCPGNESPNRALPGKHQPLTALAHPTRREPTGYARFVGCRHQQPANRPHPAKPPKRSPATGHTSLTGTPHTVLYDKIRLADNQQLRLDNIIVRSTRSEEHTSELQSLMRISYAVFCLKKKN